MEQIYRIAVFTKLKEAAPVNEQTLTFANLETICDTCFGLLYDQYALLNSDGHLKGLKLGEALINVVTNYTLDYLADVYGDKGLPDKMSATNDVRIPSVKDYIIHYVHGLYMERQQRQIMSPIDPRPPAVDPRTPAESTEKKGDKRTNTGNSMGKKLNLWRKERPAPNEEISGI